MSERCVVPDCPEPAHSGVYASIDRGEKWFRIEETGRGLVSACVPHLPEVLHRMASILQQRYPDIPIATAANPLYPAQHDEPTATDAGECAGVQSNRADRRRLDRYARRAHSSTGPHRRR